jgi:hypothetical protein
VLLVWGAVWGRSWALSVEFVEILRKKGSIVSIESIIS